MIQAVRLGLVFLQRQGKSCDVSFCDESGKSKEKGQEQLYRLNMIVIDTSRFYDRL